MIVNWKLQEEEKKWNEFYLELFIVHEYYVVVFRVDNLCKSAWHEPIMTINSNSWSYGVKIDR